jgi:hypothetical protein
VARDNKGFVCHVHTEWVSYEIHHVWPREYHGPDTKANKIKICPNAHSDIHYLMDRWLTGKPVNLRHYGASVRIWAKRGYDQVIKYLQDHPGTTIKLYSGEEVSS